MRQQLLRLQVLQRQQERSCDSSRRGWQQCWQQECCWQSLRRVRGSRERHSATASWVVGCSMCLKQHLLAAHARGFWPQLCSADLCQPSPVWLAALAGWHACVLVQWLGTEATAAGWAEACCCVWWQLLQSPASCICALCTDACVCCAALPAGCAGCYGCCWQLDKLSGVDVLAWQVSERNPRIGRDRDHCVTQLVVLLLNAAALTAVGLHTTRIHVFILC